MDSLTLPEALELFKLPRSVGNMPDGHSIRVAIGRFGPYIQYGAKKFVSIKDDDPYKIELPRALELIRAKEELDANRIILDFPDAGIQVLNGRYGPYITDRAKNAKIPKDRDPRTLTLDECKELIAAAPERGKGRFGRFAKKKATPAPEAATAAAEPAAAKPARGGGAKAAKTATKAVGPKPAAQGSANAAGAGRAGAADLQRPAKAAAKPATVAPAKPVATKKKATAKRAPTKK
jgi:DNA topoisomerase-1